MSSSNLNELISHIREIMAKGIKSSKGRICYTEHLTQANTSFGFISEVPVVIVSDLCTGGNFAE